MTNVDQFESVFRAAAKEVFAYRRPEFEKVLVVTDLAPAEAQAFTTRARSFLAVLGAAPTWSPVSGDAFRTVGELLELVDREGPDLICTYRHLHSHAWKWPHSLGEHLDVLTQETSVPVLVLPHPAAGRASKHALQNTDRVMAMTDDLTGDERLVNHAVRLTQDGGTLFLTHVEDEAVFARYLETISKIPTIDTEIAREEILHQLLKEPADYIESVRETLAAENLPIRTEAVVTTGHRLSEYKRLVHRHEVDVLVLNTRDEDQLAMHGLAYPLAVELRSIALLML